ncbi:MAG: hypothetical protein E7446_08520 [Ruminococcaceae bacterium]|nr:hypothetical protein [Oscillospiraceae bacterium]
MAELEDKLSALLSNPDSMAQVMQLAQQLSNSFGAQEQSGPTAQPQQPPQENPAPVDTAGLGSLLGGMDPKLIMKILPLLQEYGKSNSQTMQLLYALRPFLKEERQSKVERAAQLARLIHLGKAFFKEMGGLEHV